MADTGKSTTTWLASENIKNYKKRLYKTQDENERRILQWLIEEERNKLASESEAYGK